MPTNRLTSTLKLRTCRCGCVAVMWDKMLTSSPMYQFHQWVYRCEKVQDTATCHRSEDYEPI